MRGKKSKLANTTGLNSSGSPASSPELSQGYNYPPKWPSVARLASVAQVTLPNPPIHTHRNELPVVLGHRLSCSSRCLMALCDNDGALICRKDSPLEIRSMFVLHEWSTMGQFTRSIGHEILWFTVTVI